MGRLVLITPAAERLVTLDQAKAHCRCQHDAENDLFVDWIKSAEAYCQSYTNRALLTSTYRWIDTGFPCKGKAIDFLISPVQQITGVDYVDAEGNAAALSSGDYQLEAHNMYSKLWEGVGTCWPSTQVGNVSAVTVELIAGYTSKELVPVQFKQAMLLIIGQWYANRSEIIVGTIVATPPIAANRLLDQVAAERYL
jgi:uncharacterized phiE125 gp8 family phage protein